MKLCIPDKALDQHLVILGKTGAGKSSALRHIVEYLLSHKKRVCVVDPKGDWWGLKSSADGKSAGFPVIAFGDFKEAKASDVPINDQSGKHVAELISSGNRPCIIGFRGWMTSHMVRFWIDFASTIFNANSGELYLVVDEFHNFAPKGKIMDPDAGKCLHWSNRLLSEGRGLGIVCLTASQRPQKVHNDSLTSHETLVAMRVIHAADRNAIKEWIEGCGDMDTGRQVLNSLAGLARGEAFVWSPEIRFGPERVKFPMFQTFDSFAPPQLQKKVSEKGWADVDLVAVKEKLAAVIQEQKANDPKELRRQIAELKRAAAAAPTQPAAPPPAKIKTVEKFVLKDGQLDRAERLLERLVKSMELSRDLHVAIGTAATTIGAAIESTKHRAEPIPTATPPRPPASRPAPRVMAPQAAADGEFAPNGSQQRILNALAWMQSIGVHEVSRSAVGLLARIKPTGGHFSNTIGPLSTHGLIGYSGDRVYLTDVGARLAQAPKAPLTLSEYHNAIRAVMKNGATRRILDAILSAGEQEQSLEQISQATGIDHAGGHFSNSIGPLGTLGLIERRSGVVTPTQLLFPPHLVSGSIAPR